MTKFIRYNCSVVNVKELKDIELESDAIIFNFYSAQGNSFWYVEMQNKEKLPLLFSYVIQFFKQQETLFCDLDDLMKEKNQLF